MTANLEPSRDPADAELFDHIGIVLRGTRQIAAYMQVSPASIVRWRRSFRGREELHLCFPAMLIPGRGRQWRLFANTKLIANWMEHWARIDAGNAQAKERWKRKPAKTKRRNETQKEVAPAVEGESRPSLREASQPPKEPCPCRVPSRCLVHDEPFKGGSGPTFHEDPPARFESRLERPVTVNQPALRRRLGIERPEGCVCGSGLICTAHD
jgi:hypothetical protein